MDLVDKYLSEKKVTRATINSILKKVKADKYPVDVEVDSDTIAIWYDLDNDRKAKALKDAIVKHLPSASITSDGYKYLIYWKGSAPDLTRVNVR